MPFFQGAYNFQIQGGNFSDNSYGNTNIEYHAPVLPQPVTTPYSGVDPPKPIAIERQIEDRGRGHYTGILYPFYVLYTIFLLRLPNVYLGRIERLGGQADLARERLLHFAVHENWAQPPLLPRTGKAFLNHLLELENNVRSANDAYQLPPSYLTLRILWGNFVDGLLQEWQTLNFVSALLVPGILTVFQITGAANNPISRYLAFWSLLSALLSLLYGCLFIIQFSQMKKATVGMEWMTEALNDKSALLWAVDIMLALPAIWLAWSILAFIACIMTFLWRVNFNSSDVFQETHAMVLGFRVFISVILGVGSTYVSLSLYTFRRYGLNLDQAIARQIDDVLDVPVVP